MFKFYKNITWLYYIWYNKKITFISIYIDIIIFIIRVYKYINIINIYKE